MSKNEKTENQGNNEQTESATDQATTDRAAVRTLNDTLQRARDHFQWQVNWLTGYLFIVNEQLSIEPRISTEVALSYLESLQSVIIDAETDLNDVAQLAKKLYKAMTRESKSEQQPQPSPDPYALLRGWRACMAGTRPSDWEQIVSHLLKDTDAALANAEATAQKTEAREVEGSTEPSGGA